MQLILVLTIIAAVGLAIIAAIFSVTGLSMVFAGHQLYVIIMASMLEFGKIILASIIFRYWNVIKFLMKIYMVTALIILMIITSAGIFGYLSEAYSETKNKYTIVDNDILLLENKKLLFNNEIERLNNRIKNLTDARIKQESRLDGLYSTSRLNSARRLEETIKIQENEISKLNSIVTAYSDSLIKIESEINLKKSEILSGDLGPIVYIANVFNTSVDTVVKYLILILIFVFDPLAIMLIFAANIIYLNRGRERKEWTDIFEEFKNKINKNKKDIKQTEIDQTTENIKKEEIKQEDNNQIENKKEENITEELLENKTELVSNTETKNNFYNEISKLNVEEPKNKIEELYNKFKWKSANWVE